MSLMMSDIKQVFVVRKDLGMRKGKMCAQVAHASNQILLDQISGDLWKPTKEMMEWLANGSKKVTLHVSSEEELLSCYNSAKDAGLPCSLIQDAGRTEFHGVATYTAIAIGPHHSDRIDVITGELKLL